MDYALKIDEEIIDQPEVEWKTYKIERRTHKHANIMNDYIRMISEGLTIGQMALRTGLEERNVRNMIKDIKIPYGMTYMSIVQNMR